MSPQQSVFYDAWRECLREHFLHVVRTGDEITEPSLRSVLQNTGFSEEEIEVLRGEALQNQNASGDSDLGSGA